MLELAGQKSVLPTCYLTSSPDLNVICLLNCLALHEEVDVCGTFDDKKIFVLGFCGGFLLILGINPTGLFHAFFSPTEL